MKKYIVFTLLNICYSIIAMNNNDTRPVRFDSASVLFHRLYLHDKKHSTRYVPLSEMCKLHDRLGDSIQLRSHADNIIKQCLKYYDPDMSDAELITHKRTIMNAFRPELCPENPAKL